MTTFPSSDTPVSEDGAFEAIPWLREGNDLMSRIGTKWFLVKEKFYNCDEAAAFRGLLVGIALSAGFWGICVFAYWLLVLKH